MATEPDKLEILETGLLLLSRVEPEMATAVWLQAVEGCTREEIAAKLECDVRTVRRWLDGIPTPGSKHHVTVLGGRALLRIIVNLLETAQSCGSFQALVHAFEYASGRNAWRTPFSAALLERLRVAQAGQALERVLGQMNTAYREQRFTQYIQDLLLEGDVRFR